MNSSVKIDKGQLLLAEPFMMDPNFRRSVILLCEHQEEGSLGFILNKPLKMRVDRLVAGFPEFEAVVYYGGPVANDTIHFLHHMGDLIEGSLPIGNNTFWGGDFEKLKFLIESKVLKPRDIKFFAGYSGWSTGQLDEELNIGTWITAEMDPNYLFAVPSKDLWSKVLSVKGDNFAVLANIPDQISWN